MKASDIRPARLRRTAMVALAAIGLGLAATGAAQSQSFGFATFSATINVNGTTARGSGVQSSSRPATGRYIVVFTRNVKQCAYAAATRGTAGGQASVQPVSGKAKQLEVRTFNKSGGAANLGFTLLVSCV